MKKLMVAAVAFAGLVVSAALDAEASYVYKDTSAGDSRLVVANTTFSNVIDRAASAGLWIRDIIPDSNNMASDATIFGCRHVNAGIHEDGFCVVFHNRSSLAYNLCGKNASGQTVYYQYVSVTNDISWCHDGRWHFILFTCDCDAKEVKVYLDGVCLHTKAITLETIRPVRSYAFGGGQGKKTESDSAVKDDYGCGWIGYFAEATVWNRALTEAEAAELATRRVKYDAEGLLAYWPCNERSGHPVNWAKNPAHRSDGKEVCAYARALSYVDDPNFFSMPSGYFVVTPEWAAKNGYVMADGCKADTLAKPATNIQYALDKATADGSIINLLPGTYYPTATLLAKCNSLLLRSYNPETDDFDREGTVLDGFKMASGSSIFSNNSKTKPTVNSLTFCNTTAARAIYLQSAGTFKILNSSFTNLTVAATGGGVHCWTCNGGLFSNCTFRACSAIGGGGIYTIQNGFTKDDFCTVQNCTFIGNKATLGSNNNDNCGGGVEGSRNIHVYDCVFHDNESTQKGGHLFCGQYAIVSGCTFGGAASSAYGSGVFTDNDATITNCQFVGATSGAGFGYLHPSTNTKILNCVVTNNQYTAAFVFNEGKDNIVVRQCLFADNRQSAVITGHNSTSAFFENCTVAMTGAMKGDSSNTSKVVFQNCILGGTVTSSASHQAIVSNCVVKALGGTPHEANFNVYAGRALGFKNAAAGDYTLRPTAFARDRAVKIDWMTDASVDLAGNPRLVNRRGVADAPDALPDLGCYEIQSAFPATCVLYLK